MVAGNDSGGRQRTTDVTETEDTIVNPMSGERLTFLNTGFDTDGEFTRVRFTLPPRGRGTPAHFHTIFSERFRVVSGRLSVILGNRDGSKTYHVLGPGDSASVPPRVVHRFWNATDQETVFEAEVRPSGGFGTFMRTSFGLARDGRTTKGGTPRNVLELGLLMQPADVYLPGVPVAIQAAIFKTLASTARSLGYGPGFERYADPDVDDRLTGTRAYGMLMQAIDSRAETLAGVVGWVSFGIGLLLTLAPRRSADLLGWERRTLLTVAVGLADLVIGPAILLGGRDRARWMMARAILNAGLASIYAWILATGAPRRRRAFGGISGMSILTLTDYFLARRLRNIESECPDTDR